MSINAFSQLRADAEWTRLKSTVAAYPPVPLPPVAAAHKSSPTVTTAATRSAVVGGSGIAGGDAPNTPRGTGADAEYDLTFHDALSVINPLQHLPIIGTLYREATGDTINPTARVLGGILFGGVTGGIGAVFDAIMEQKTGKDMGGTLYAALFEDDSTPAPPNAPPTANAPVVVADNTVPAPPPVPPPAPRTPVASQPVTVTTLPERTNRPPAAVAPATVIPAATGPDMGSTVRSGDENAIAALSRTHHPSLMPARGVVEVRTTTPERVSTSSIRRPNFSSAAVSSSIRPAPALAGNEPSSPSSRTWANTQPVPIPPEAVSQVMARNYDKYQRAARSSAASTVATSAIPNTLTPNMAIPNM
ncbi:conserved hypothetical protein [uncultured Gammaproteobacteria bacterium]